MTNEILPPGDLSVDGISIKRRETPGSAEEVAALLASAAEQGEAVVPIGGGTQLGLGNVPTGADIGLSLGALDRVIAHEPDDLTLSVEAGITLAELNRTLGERGQWLPIEAPDPERATIGGLIATAFTGPRKLGSESLRDLLVGISVAHPTGAISKAGGTVVKNVTGFDMMRLYHGSLGTLGVVVSANFKVLPRPRMERTLFADFADVAGALGAARNLLGLRGRPVALELVCSNDSTWRLAARYEGRPGTVAIMAEEAAAALKAPTTSIDDADSSGWWQGYVDFYAAGQVTDRVVVRMSSRPRETGEVVKLAMASVGEGRFGEIRVSPGMGRVDLAIDPADVSVSDRHAFLDRLGAGATSVVLYDAPAAWKQDRDAWGPAPETIDLMRALKVEFDPGRVLNPGRFAGFI